MDDYRLFLTLPPQPGVRLLVKFQAPGKAKPDDSGATFLQI